MLPYTYIFIRAFYIYTHTCLYVNLKMSERNFNREHKQKKRNLENKRMQGYIKIEDD